MKKILTVSIIIVVLLIGGCSSSQEKQQNNIQQATNKMLEGGSSNDIETVQSQEFHETIGMGAPSANSKNSAMKKQTSYEAAKAAALNDLASFLYGVKLTSGMTVKDAELQDSTITTEVSALVRGAEIVKREWDDEYSCIVTIRFNLSKFKQKLQQLGLK